MPSARFFHICLFELRKLWNSERALFISSVCHVWSFLLAVKENLEEKIKAKLRKTKCFLNRIGVIYETSEWGILANW
jgi:hypothetical protein